MHDNRRIFRYIVNAVTFIILEVAALAVLYNNGAIQKAWLSRMFHGFAYNVWGRTENIKHYFSLNRENAELAERNFMLEQELRAYREKYGPSDVLKDSITGKFNTGNFKYIHASIVKMSRNKQHNYLILGKGYDDGISPMSGLITSCGAIGIVDAVSKNYSHVKMFTSAGMAVSARIGHEGAVGSLSWDGKSTKGAILSEIPHHIVINQGDTVYTSGFSAIFPPDIPLGTIGEKKLVNGSSYEINISLFEDFSRLRYVTVVDNDDIKELEELEVK